MNTKIVVQQINKQLVAVTLSWYHSYVSIDRISRVNYLGI